MQGIPSLKRLQAAFGPEAGRKVRGILADLPTWPEHDTIDAALDAITDTIGACGVESIRGAWIDRYYQDIVALYANTGDSYESTILYETDAGRFLLTTMGDWVERYGDACGVK